MASKTPSGRPARKAGVVTRKDLYSCLQKLEDKALKSTLMVGMSQAGSNEKALRKLYDRCMNARGGS